MFKILNRFAWILSFLSAFLVILIFFDKNVYYFLDFSETLFIIVLIIFAFIIKWIFLSKKFIKNNITEFAENLVKFKQDRVVSKVDSDEIKDIKQEEIIENTWNIIQKQEIKDKNIQNIDMTKIPDDIKVNYNFSYETESKEILKVDSDEISSEIEKTPWIFQKFFSENVFAKIWWILIFIWMIFFITLIYKQIWALWQVIIWFLVWFIVYAVWWYLDKKWFEQESRVLFWVWILINYLVILGWRYLIKISDLPYFTEWITFLFLVANTLFAIITSMKFNSKTLLIFSFVFAYINPFLIWWTSDNPYTLVSYSMVISIWIFVLAYFRSNLWDNSIYQNLLYIWVIWWNITILIAPFSSSFHWIFKLVALAILSICAIVLTLYKKDTKNISWVFMSAYLFFMFLLFYGNITIDSFYSWFDIYLSYIVFLFFFMLLGVYFVIFSTITVFWWLLFSPLVFLGWIAFMWDFIYLVPTFAIFTFFFLIIFSLVYKKLDNKKTNIFFIILLLYAFICWLNISSFTAISLNTTDFYIVLSTLFLFMWFASYFSKKNWLQNLYSIWTVGTGIILLSIIRLSGPMMYLSVASVVLFWLINIVVPFLNQKLFEWKRLALIWWVVAGMLFLLINVRRFGDLYLSDLQLWFLFLALTTVYLMIWFYFTNKFFQEKDEFDEFDKNVIYTYFATAIILFCIAVWFVFADISILVPIVWLFVSNLIFFLFTRFKDKKIYMAWLIILVVSILYLLSINVWKISNLPYLLVMSASLVLNLYFANKNEFEDRLFFDIVYMVWHIVILRFISNILKTDNFSYVYLGFTIYLFLLSIVNYYLWNSRIKLVHMVCLWYLSFIHFISFQPSIDKINYLVQTGKVNYIHKFLEYFIIIINLLNVYFSRKNNKEFKLILYYIWFIYFFFMTTFAININFENTFIITIYWWIFALALLFYWLNQNFIKFRTLGLYIIVLTLSKVFFYDIWYGFSDAISRVLAFIILWVIMIYISILYTKKLWKPMKEELNFVNLSIED